VTCSVFYIYADAEENTTRTAVNFDELPFEATVKYLAMNGIHMHYPPQGLVQDPRTEGEPSYAHEEELPEEQPENTEEAESGTMLRTRSATSERRRQHETKDETQFFDKDAAHSHFAAIATEHYNAQPPPKESDMVVSFLYRCRVGGTWHTRGG